MRAHWVFVSSLSVYIVAVSIEWTPRGGFGCSVDSPRPSTKSTSSLLSCINAWQVFAHGHGSPDNQSSIERYSHDIAILVALVVVHLFSCKRVMTWPRHTELSAWAEAKEEEQQSLGLCNTGIRTCKCGTAGSWLQLDIADWAVPRWSMMSTTIRLKITVQREGPSAKFDSVPWERI
jgi:hypothetical protein